MEDLIDFFGEPIHTYTRAEALVDGVLVDVTESAREAGFRFDVVLTRACHEDCVAFTDEDNKRKGTVQDEAGRLWDVVWMASLAMRRARHSDTDTVVFEVLRVPREGKARTAKVVRLKAKVGPGDDFEPVITIDLAS